MRGNLSARGVEVVVFWGSAAAVVLLQISEPHRDVSSTQPLLAFFRDSRMASGSRSLVRIDPVHHGTPIGVSPLLDWHGRRRTRLVFARCTRDGIRRQIRLSDPLAVHRLFVNARRLGGDDTRLASSCCSRLTLVPTSPTAASGNEGVVP